MRFMFAWFALTLVVTMSSATEKRIGGNQHVAVTVTVEEKRIRPGTSASFLFRFVPREGYRVKLEPMMVFIPENESKSMVKLENLIAPAKTGHKYLDRAKPVMLPFTLSDTLGVGTKTIRGTLTYYYCSDTEGWCSRFNQPVEVDIQVVK